LVIFIILLERNIPNISLTTIIKILEDKMKIKLDATLTWLIKINKKVRQGQPLSPTLMHIQIRLLQNGKKKREKESKVSGNADIKVLLFMGDKVTMVDSEDVLQISTHKVERGTSKYGIKISTSKMKTVAFREEIQWEVKV